MNKNLVDFRNQRKLTQREMAIKLGTTLSYYSKVELGLRNPSYNFLDKFKKQFKNICVDEMFF